MNATTFPRIVEVRRYHGAVTVELSDGVSMPADTPEEIEAIAAASMHSIHEVYEAIDDSDEGRTNERNALD